LKARDNCSESGSVSVEDILIDDVMGSTIEGAVELKSSGEIDGTSGGSSTALTDKNKLLLKLQSKFSTSDSWANLLKQVNSAPSSSALGVDSGCVSLNEPSEVKRADSLITEANSSLLLSGGVAPAGACGYGMQAVLSLMEAFNHLGTGVLPTTTLSHLDF
jgi:hypothetical protein